ncbi:beta-ketoacyl-[acyl-carrier-protein] synthase family protein [Kitasatospora azatica]|uniref:beta-ketoacyl-[acyl-carrier-protein] synthase family protein n=1 Tax=Kitasatospora azatica TaxID=58347 RepID=UPI000560D1E2|nr:beta-ketoacyl-[acyl-carrier-protein] synthase family protein [Kitasatospora azatica]
MAATAWTGPEVAVTGLGVVSAAGIGVATSWERVCAGLPTAATDPELAGLPVDFSCRIPDFEPQDHLDPRSLWRMDRTTQLALVAANEAIADAGLDPAVWDGARVGIVLGTSNGGGGTLEREHTRLVHEGPEWISPLVWVMAPVNMLAGSLAIELGAHGPNLVTATACASGPTAIATAAQFLRADMCDVVIAGGAEAPITPMAFAGLYQMGALSQRTTAPAQACRPFDSDRDGMVAAEGAGILVLERSADARARGARIRARIAGYGASADGYHLSAPDPTGTHAEAATRIALATAGVSPGDVDHVNAHGSSTPLNDITEGQMLRRVYGDRPAVTSTKGVTGHALGAAGAMEAAFTVLSLENGLIPPTANLECQDPEIDVDVVAGDARKAHVDVAVTNSFGFGGQNAVLVISAA